MFELTLPQERLDVGDSAFRIYNRFLHHSRVVAERVLCDNGLPKTDLEYKLQITCVRYIGGVEKYK